VSYEDKLQALLQNLSEKQIRVVEKKSGKTKKDIEYLCTCSYCNNSFTINYSIITKQKDIICSNCASINPEIVHQQLSGTIYKVTFPNGKIYIGQTIQKPHYKRFKSHLKDAFNQRHPEYYTPIGRAIRKYKQLGQEIKYEAVAENVKWSDLDDLEIATIKELNATNKEIGYNVSDGGKYNRINALKAKEHFEQHLFKIEQQKLIEKTKMEKRELTNFEKSLKKSLNEFLSKKDNTKEEELERIRKSFFKGKKVKEKNTRLANGLDKKSSKYRGVCLDNTKSVKGKWRANIKHKGVKIHIGLFDTEKEAAEAYNKKAIELLGDAAKLNVID
jgi:hypothetical protein